MLEVNYREKDVEGVNDRVEMRIFSGQSPIPVRALKLGVEIDALRRRSHQTRAVGLGKHAGPEKHERRHPENDQRWVIAVADGDRKEQVPQASQSG